MQPHSSFELARAACGTARAFVMKESEDASPRADGACVDSSLRADDVCMDPSLRADDIGEVPSLRADGVCMDSILRGGSLAGG